MFQKILIANRGEIACRIMRAARRMGIKTVAVYSEADRRAMHVAMADEAILLGPAPSSESYLAIDKIVAACQSTGAEAIHPGYGFLSENALFAEAVEQAGIAFIGPSSATIRSMGDKVEAKRIAEAAGLATVPGGAGVIADADQAVATANAIGYPVMIKASAGGGGKGMRIARDDEQCRQGFERCTSEALSAFGDGRVFVERFIENPRHIEIQVLADSHGNVVHLGERECSLQRRHQKVIEEAPSPALDAAARQAMGQRAVSLARAVDYVSAGTVEFIVDAECNDYFLEMNTRLQVEHPVTELVTGLDLVECMIRVAAGETLPVTQAQVVTNGWAIEARICAEDPARGFLPSIGRLVQFVPPAESDVIRVDTGVCEGDEVSMHYDPMIAKLIAHGPTRELATKTLQDALNRFYIRGVSHNISFLSALLAHERFQSGQLSTNLIGQDFTEGYQAADHVPEDSSLFVAVAAVMHRRIMQRNSNLSGQLPGKRSAVPTSWTVAIGENEFAVDIKPAEGNDEYDVQLAASCHRVQTNWRPGQSLVECKVNDDQVWMTAQRLGSAYILRYNGVEAAATVLTPQAAELRARMPPRQQPDLSQFLLSPMPGMLAELLVSAGSDVKQGQELAVVEAMKMENVLRAERDGRVLKSLAKVGETLVVDQPILEFEAAG